ncbi:MAG: nickel insertion protein, partial [Myxococcota bacterium]|nr:nickel insertion protein [Myxococcota bacterium]
MTKHIHIDMIGGLAGDMFLAASLNAGLVEQSELEKVLSMVGIGQIAITLEQVKRYGIKGTHISFSGWPPEQERDHRHLSEIEEMISSSALEDRVKTRAIEMFRALGKVESD